MRIALQRFAERLQVGSPTSGGEGSSDNGVFARVVERVYEASSLIVSMWDGSGMSHMAEDDECNPLGLGQSEITRGKYTEGGVKFSKC
jgi:hypothetical protein